jgi:hypothetical protein
MPIYSLSKQVGGVYVATVPNMLNKSYVGVVPLQIYHVKSLLSRRCLVLNSHNACVHD